MILTEPRGLIIKNKEIETTWIFIVLSSNNFILFYVINNVL